jgi:hypothetical protein
MPSSGMFRPVALVLTDISEKRIASIIRLTRIGELRMALAVTTKRSRLRRNTVSFLRSVFRLLVTAKVFPTSHVLVTQMIEVIGSS